MTRRIGLLILLTAYGSCMEMRETVERMVMVRTTGSDLQPAATGYIYKKDADGPASFVKMGESEVMAHLSKLYEEPKSYAAPAPPAAGPFHAKEDDGSKAASYTKEDYVIPVVEKQEDDKGGDHDPIDGIAHEDYGKIFGEYAGDYDHYKSDFNDYLKSLGYYKGGPYGEFDGGKDFGAKEHHEYGGKENKGYVSKHHYGKGGAGDYHTEKYESYHVKGEGGHKKGYDEHDDSGKHYAHGHGYKGDDHGHKTGHSKGEEVEGFHKLYDNNEFKKDHDTYDDAAHKGGYYKFDKGHEYHGSDAGKFEKGGSHDSGVHKSGFGKGGFHDKHSGEEHGHVHAAKEGGEAANHHHGEYGTKGGDDGGKGYGYHGGDGGKGDDGGKGYGYKGGDDGGKGHGHNGGDEGGKGYGYKGGDDGDKGHGYKGGDDGGKGYGYKGGDDGGKGYSYKSGDDGYKGGHDGDKGYDHKVGGFGVKDHGDHGTHGDHGSNGYSFGVKH